jgi:succinate-semialdehyde dehydrogenase/glutarate-semialdehyde dehydrogenase
LYQPFLDLVVRKTKKLRVGPGEDEQTEIGPLINDRQLRTVESHVEEAIACGARLLIGGHRLPDLSSNFYAPTILADVTHNMRIMREETFGPVLPVMAFDTDEEAIRLANDSEFGLAASVWTKDRARGEALARQIQAGTVMINDAISYFGISEAPHGGVKASGIGRTHGCFGMEEMTRLKYVDSDRLPNMKKVWWYGYGAEFRTQMEGFADFLFAGRVGQKLRGMLRSAGALRRKNQI